MGVGLKPSLLKSSSEQAEEDVAEFLASSLDTCFALRAVGRYFRVDGTHHRGALLDVIGDCRVVLSGKDKSDFASLFGKHLAKILEAVVFTNSIKSVMDLARASLLQCVFDPGD